MNINSPIIKFTHEEVEALLRLLDDYEGDLNNNEESAKVKLKKIYARQILSHEKREREMNYEQAKSSGE